MQTHYRMPSDRRPTPKLRNVVQRGILKDAGDHLAIIIPKCVACGKRHTHGAALGDKLPTHRVSHCLFIEGVYAIESA